MRDRVIRIRLKPKRLPLESAYNSVKFLIIRIVTDFQRQYGKCEHVDLYSEAKLVFVSSYRQYDPKRAKLSTWTQLVVWTGLIDASRKQWRHNEHGKVVPLTGKEQATKPSSFDLASFTKGMSEDAVHIIKLVLNPPKDFKAPCPNNPKFRILYTRQLWAWLDKEGWDENRRIKGYSEIQTALEDWSK